MSETQYRIVFQGRLRAGFEHEHVIDNLAHFLRKEPAQLNRLFSGKPVVLKKSTDLAIVNKIASSLAELGLEVVVSPTSDTSLQHPPPPSKLTANDAVASDAPVELPIRPKPETPSVSAHTTYTNEVTLQQRLKYRFDTFMAKGGISIFKALVAVFVGIFLIIAALRALIFAINPDLAQQYESLDLLGNVYITFLQLTDPGNMAQDILSSAWYKFFAVLAGIAGIVMLSALIAFITTALDQKISELKRGHSKVIEENHTLILGWNEQRIVEIIRELIFANESESDGCVVILANKDKEDMDEILRLRLPNRATTRIVTRSGQTASLPNLDMVSVETCRSVIILASCEDTDTAEQKIASDAKVIQTILAISGKNSDDTCIVAEIFNEAYRGIIENTFPDQVVIVNTSDVLAKLLVQTSRSVGLSVVYNELLSFDGCEMYFYQSDWLGLSFGQLAYHFPDGVPMGVHHGDGSMTLNPDSQYRMKDDDSILIVAEDDSTIDFHSSPLVTPIYYELPDKQLVQKVERELLVGWNHKAPIIINEFADYVKSGSEIDIVIHHPSENEKAEIARLNQDLENIDIRLLELNSLNRDHLFDIKPFTYDNIIILASNRDSQEAQQVDSENIVTLLLVRGIFNEHPDQSHSTKLITEIMDSQNLPLVARAGVKDVIISNRLLSMIIAQISENKNIKAVYDDIFQEDGSEIYLKPADLYFSEFPVNLTFADIIAIAQQRNEVCIGVKIAADEWDSSRNNGVELVPAKTSTFILNAEDSLVVLAENEL